MSGRLWQGGRHASLDAAAGRYTVGEDWRLDARLLTADCLGSLAHAHMLTSIGILSERERTAIHGALLEIIDEHHTHGVPITPQDEDGHTVIENRLTQRCGVSGRRIHSGRSRNDQSLTAICLYGRAVLLRGGGLLYDLAARLLRLAEEWRDLPMIGRTHMQPAMLSSVGLWASAYVEQLLDDGLMLRAAYGMLDRCPLGSAAGYGVPLPLDREMSALLLGFGRLHHNVLAAGSARGRVELCLLQGLEQAGITLGKLAQEIILFSLPEFGYLRLPADLCTGSSIMPQKRNPDVLELVRARSAALSGCVVQVGNIVRGLPSGYQRDYQETKGSLLRGCDLALETLAIMGVVVERVEVCEAAMRSSLVPEIFAVDAAIERVRAGETFRDAYQHVAAHLAELRAPDVAEALAARTSTGAPGNLRLDLLRDRLAAERDYCDAEVQRVDLALETLAGRPVDLLQPPAQGLTQGT